MPVPDVQKIGKYEILAELGQGGYGRVYRAFDPTVGRPVAIKILTAESSRDLLTRFRNEATAAGNLRHRNIVTVYDYGEYNDRPFLVMELLEGQDLTQVIANRTPLSLLQKMNIMDQIAAGLDCAHQNGVFHRDVKPANIRILPDGTVKIMDFGIARVNSGRNATRLTQQGDLIGTILYMSPEQFAGSEADALCDIFAYGLIYFELLTGKHPFRSSDPRAVMFKITMDDPESVRALEPDCPEALERILNRALQKDRELRYQSLRDLQLDAEPLMFELRQERAAKLLADALELCGDSRSPQALPLINEALNLDPSNREARKLRERVQGAIQREALQPRIELLLQSAAKHVAARSFGQAIQSLESAQKLDPNDERIMIALQSARQQLNRVKEAGLPAAAALAHLGRGEWLEASSKCLEVARIDPLNPALVRVRSEIGKHVRDVLAAIDPQIDDDTALAAAIDQLSELVILQPESPEVQRQLATANATRAARAQAEHEARERDLAIQRTVEVSNLLRNENRFEEALETAEQGLSKYPDAPSLLDLQARLQTELGLQREQAEVRRASDAARNLLGEGKPAQAVDALQEAAKQYPGDEGLRHLLMQARETLQSQQHREAVETALMEARKRAENREFSVAIQVLEDALASWPQESSLEDLLRTIRNAQEQWQQEQDAQALRQQADFLTDEERFDEALQLIKGGLERFPAEPGLLQRRDHLLEFLQREHRAAVIREVLEEGSGLIKRGTPAQAIELLTQAFSQYPDEAEFEKLLAEARSALHTQQHREAVEKALEEARTKSDHADFAGAIRVLEVALGQWPAENGHDSALTEALDRARSAQKDWERSQELTLIVQQSRDLAHESRYPDAIDVVQAGLSELPDEPLLTELLRELNLQWEVAERVEAVHRATEDSRTLLREGRAERALQILTSASARYPGEESLKQLLLEAHRTLEAQRRREAVERAAFNARELTAREDFAGAIAILENALKSWPAEEPLPELLRTTRAAQTASERAAAIAEISTSGRRLLEQGQPGRAVEVLRQGCRHYVDESQLMQMLAEAQEALRLQRKREEIQTATADARRRAERRDFAGAIGILTNALKSSPDETQLVELLRETRTARETWERQEAIRSVTQQAAKLVGRNRLREALKTVQTGLRQHRQDPSLSVLQQQIEGQLASQLKAETARRQPAKAQPEQASPSSQAGGRPLLFPRRYLVGGGVAAMALAAVATLLIRGGFFQADQSVPLAIESNVSGASINVGGQSCVLPDCALKLPAGNYKLVASMDGFRSLEQPLAIKPKSGSVKVPLVFRPLPEVVQVHTNFTAGRVLLDGRPAGELRDGEFSLDRVLPGDHTIRVIGGAAEFEAQWSAKPGQAPELTQPVAAKNVQATLLANVGRSGSLACNCDVRTIHIDGNAVTQPSATVNFSMPVKDLKEGARRITAADRSLLVDVRPNPALNIFLSLDRNAGTLVIETGQDNATVFLNNRPYSRLTGHGLLRIPVDVGEYSVRAEKPGFKSSASKIMVGKGEDKQVTLVMTQLLASLEISGALPGALVTVDGMPVGTTAANGNLRADVTPGDHEIELTKGDYSPLRFGARFTAGQTTRPKPEQISMARVIQTTARADPRQTEGEDWDKIRNGTSIDALEDFLRKHPGGANADNARARISQLRQQAQAETARLAEQTAWDSVDKTRKAAVQDFVSRYGNGPHAQEARTLISELDKKEADALATSHAAAEQQKVTALRTQEQAARIAADQQAIIRTLGQYESAYNAKNLRALQSTWPGMPKSASEELGRQFRYARGVSFEMKPAGAAALSGDSATVTCIRSLNLTTTDNQKMNSGDERVRVTLERTGQGWVISSIAKL